MTTTVATTAPPNQSLYLQNLPEKLPKDDLRRALYMLFSTFGPVLDITALKTKAMRGQAHVLFRDQQSATQALRNCQGNEFFGREMRIAYSKNRSNTLAKLTGTFNQPTTTAGEQPKGPAPGSAGAAPSAFPAPPGATSNAAAPAITNGPPTSLPPPPGLPAKVGELKAPPAAAADNAPSPQGTKRPRDDESEEEDADADMEVEDDDEEGAMEMSDDED
ncbi:hypothetical protein LTR36_002340 [Oleoguttula mirabilis]|uniref:RRM domain-containing protein n=1 Tax=Oleoguttula mirabilis TaxID=1507867 RepID=A0AAV9JNT0_9PEZI|nr:hypothetical protein LTR36_002340 [Oleoguttula mirabilis]